MTAKPEEAIEVDAQDVARRLRARLPEHVEFLLFMYTAEGAAKTVMSAENAHEVLPPMRRWMVAVGDIEAFDRPHSTQGLALERLMNWIAKHEGTPDPQDPERRVDAVINRMRYLRERYAADVDTTNKLIADPELAPREGTVPDIAIAYLRAFVKGWNEGNVDGLNALIAKVPKGLL